MLHTIAAMPHSCGRLHTAWQQHRSASDEVLDLLLRVTGWQENLELLLRMGGQSEEDYCIQNDEVLQHPLEPL